MAKRYDVIVVGAGPAGFLAAKAAGENGLDVALLERRTDLAENTRACGETLVSFNEYYLGNIARYNTRDKRICFSSDGFSFKYDGPYQNLYSHRGYNTNGHIIDFGDYEQQKSRGDYGRIGLSFDKGTLFRILLEEVKACSVDVFPGINVEKVATTSDGVTVEGSGQSFEGTYVIAADGVNSRIAQAMGLNEDRTYYCNLYGISSHMSGIELREPTGTIVRTSTFIKEGHATLYLIPRFAEGEYNIVVTSMNPGLNLQTALDYFMNQAFCAPWFKKAKKSKVISAVLNLYSPIIEPYKDRVLFAGDVGSTVDLENTGALLCGWKAGQAVSTAVLEKNVGVEISGIYQYVNWWKETYIKGHNHEDMMKGVGLALILTTDEEINYINSFIKETLPPTWHPSAAGKHVGRVMAKVMPIIQQERPDIFQKLERRKLPATEIYAKLTRISKPVL